MAQSIPGPNYDREIVDGTRNNDAPFLKWLYKKMEAEAELKDVQAELDKAREDIIKQINLLECDDQKAVMMKKYINNKSWGQIADELYCSTATVRRWNDKALFEINKNMSRVEQG